MRLCQALEILGVAADADQKTIKAAYRAKLLEAHPDKGGNAEYLRRVNSAGGVAVKKPKKRGRPPKRKNGPQAAPKSERERRRAASNKVYHERRVDGHIARERRAEAKKSKAERKERKAKKMKTTAAQPEPEPNPWNARLRPEPQTALDKSAWDLRTKVPKGANGTPVKPPRKTPPRKRNDTVRMWAVGATQSLAAGVPIPSAHEGVYKPTRAERRAMARAALNRHNQRCREQHEQEAQDAGFSSLAAYEEAQYAAQYADYDWREVMSELFDSIDGN